MSDATAFLYTFFDLWEDEEQASCCRDDGRRFSPTPADPNVEELNP